MSQNPHITHYGAIIDPIAAAAWDIEDRRRRRAENPPPAFHAIRDMPRCRWYGQHRWDGIGTEHCQDCDIDRIAFMKAAPK